MSLRPKNPHRLSVFLRTARQNTRLDADFRQPAPAHLVKRGPRCSVRYVVAALPQGAETFRLIRYPSPLGGSAPVQAAHFLSRNSKCLRRSRAARSVLMKRT